MSLVFNMVGGGSGSAGLPAIYATYPAGSVCTCTNGSKTFTAKDTSGFWLFAGLEVGTWTATVTDGTNSRSQSVEITSVNQIASITLQYALYLYNKGDECVNITGGWQSRAWKEDSNANYTAVAPTLTKNANSMHIVFPASRKSGVVEVVKDIDLSGWKTLKIVLKSINNYTDNNVAPRLIIVPRSATFWYDATVGFVVFNKGQAGEYSIDLTALTLTESKYDIAIGGETYTSEYVLDVESVLLE